MAYCCKTKNNHALLSTDRRIAFKKAIRLSVLFGIVMLTTAAVSIAQEDHSRHNASPIHSGHDMGHPAHPDMFETDDSSQQQPGAATDPAADSAAAGITENLGQFISADIEFVDETGNVLVLGDFIDRPTLILPVFYHCPKTCSLLLSNLSRALNDVTFTPGQSYRVLSFSFDDEETPEDAASAKKNYLTLLRKDFPADEWRFLTGNIKNINSLAGDMGFQFKKIAAHSFLHPNILLCVGPDRKIIRYLYGPDFLPFDISMAIAEAERGTPGISIKKIVSLCFDYDPKGKRYVFKTFRISGIIIITLLTGFIFFLVRKKPSGNGEK